MTCMTRYTPALPFLILYYALNIECAAFRVFCAYDSLQDLLAYLIASRHTH